MRLTDLTEAVRRSGLEVVPLPGWQTRERPASSGGFAPVGVEIHHTGGESDAREYVEWMAYTGRTDLPAPLCQLALSRLGVVYVVAAGRANHAGVTRARGDWLRAGDGNAQLLGIEALNTGTERWSATQYGAYVRLCAALCHHYGWPAAHVVAHYETSTTGKWDPGDPGSGHGPDGRSLDMARFRREVGRAITELEESEHMPTADEIAAAVWQRQFGRADNRETAAQHLLHASNAARASQQALAGLADAIAAAVVEDVNADLAAGGGIEPLQLRRIVFAQATRAINERLGSLDEK